MTLNKHVLILASIVLLYSVFFSINTKWDSESKKAIESECYTSEFPILMYHHIRPYTHLWNTSAQNLSVSPEEFEEQMKYFADMWWQTINTNDIKWNSVPCKTFLITFDDGYHDIYKYAAPILEKYKYTGLMSLIPAHIDESDYMSGDNIRTLLDREWEIASHTWTHPVLTRISIDNITTEVQKSKHDLEKWFWIPVKVFVYPGWFYGPETLKKVEATWYRFAFTTHTGYAKLGYKNLELKRINIPPGTTVEKLQKLLERKPTP